MLGLQTVLPTWRFSRFPVSGKPGAELVLPTRVGGVLANRKWRSPCVIALEGTAISLQVLRLTLQRKGVGNRFSIGAHAGVMAG
jgi:hypothetical protein